MTLAVKEYFEEPMRVDEAKSCGGAVPCPSDKDVADARSALGMKGRVQQVSGAWLELLLEGFEDEPAVLTRL